MRFFIILITLIVGGVYFFAEFKADNIAKNIIENEATKAAEREVKIDNLKIDFLKEQVTLKNITIKNNDGFPGDLLKIKDVKIITSSSPSVKKRSVPNEPAKDYDVGHQLMSGNDNNMYEVIANKNGVKRWKKIKTE